MRKRLAADGITVETPEHVKAMRLKAAETRRGIRVPETPGSGGNERTEPETGAPEPKVDPLADMKPLKGGAEYYALTEKLRDATPGCAGIAEFIADKVDADTVAMMADIRAHCPILARCRDFAITSRPAAGFWAGMSQAAVRALNPA